MKKEDVIEFIGSLSDEDLAAFYYEAMVKKNEYRRHDDGTFWNHIYVIGIASHTEDGPAEVEIIATAFNPGSLFLMR